MIPFSDEELYEPVLESLKVVMPMLERDGRSKNHKINIILY